MVIVKLPVLIIAFWIFKNVFNWVEKSCLYCFCYHRFSILVKRLKQKLNEL